MKRRPVLRTATSAFLAAVEAPAPGLAYAPDLQNAPAPLTAAEVDALRDFARRTAPSVAEELIGMLRSVHEGYRYSVSIARGLPAYRRRERAQREKRMAHVEALLEADDLDPDLRHHLEREHGRLWNLSATRGEAPGPGRRHGGRPQGSTDWAREIAAAEAHATLVRAGIDPTAELLDEVLAALGLENPAHWANWAVRLHSSTRG